MWRNYNSPSPDSNSILPDDDDIQAISNQLQLNEGESFCLQDLLVDPANTTFVCLFFSLSLRIVVCFLVEGRFSYTVELNRRNNQPVYTGTQTKVKKE